MSVFFRLFRETVQGIEFSYHRILGGRKILADDRPDAFFFASSDELIHHRIFHVAFQYPAAHDPQDDPAAVVFFFLSDRYRDQSVIPETVDQFSIESYILFVISYFFAGFVCDKGLQWFRKNNFVEFTSRNVE